VRRPAPTGSPTPGRRAFLLLAAAGLATACAPSPAAPRRRALASTGAPATPPVTAPPVAPVTAPTAATREEIVARYAGVAPSAFGLDAPGVVNRLPTQERVVALTFDACGGPRGSGYDAALIDTLRTTGTPATLFLNQRWVRAHPDLAAELAADPLFELANHGTVHLPLSMRGAAA
jgi:peptidoglycan/xylan/chitin deacetylase (PgdA/CDA1 family)